MFFFNLSYYSVYFPAVYFFGADKNRVEDERDRSEEETPGVMRQQQQRGTFLPRAINASNHTYSLFRHEVGRKRILQTAAINTNYY